MLHVYVVLGFPTLAYLSSLARKDTAKGKRAKLNRSCITMNKKIFFSFYRKNNFILFNSTVQQLNSTVQPLNSTVQQHF